MSIKNASEMTQDELVMFLTMANAQYRAGTPVVSDDEYDHVYLARLKEINPSHPFLSGVEPEVVAETNKVVHTTPLLSTDKAYESDDVIKFVARVIRTAKDMGIMSPVMFEITPKLDGIAGSYEDGVLATRGNGLQGNDISSIIKRGVRLVRGDRLNGVGEVVVAKSYFDANLADSFKHPRNFISGLASSDSISTQGLQALEDGAVHFTMFSSLQAIVVDSEELSQNVVDLCKKAESSVDYLTDGAVISVVDERIRNVMGSTSHHNKWQIAKKVKGDQAETSVTAITWQTGRTGPIDASTGNRRYLSFRRNHKPCYGSSCRCRYARRPKPRGTDFDIKGW